MSKTVAPRIPKDPEAASVLPRLPYLERDWRDNQRLARLTAQARLTGRPLRNPLRPIPAGRPPALPRPLPSLLETEEEWTKDAAWRL